MPQRDRPTGERLPHELTAGAEPAAFRLQPLSGTLRRLMAAFPKRRPELFQEESLEGARLWRSWHRSTFCPQGLDLSTVPGSWQEVIFQLAFTAVVEEADHGCRPDILSQFGRPGSSFQRNPKPWAHIVTLLSFSTEVPALRSPLDVI